MTGTCEDKRNEFQRMMKDCRKGKIDRIYTKSISRFARNTKDCLKNIRELKSLGITVFFEKENIDTANMPDEMMITIMGGLAQEESTSISQNMRWSCQKRMMNGTYPVEKIKKGNPEYALRAKGKVAELALGYQGSAPALVNMGALKMGLTEDELPDIVRRWSAANKRIVALWYAAENVVLECMRTAKQTGINKGIFFNREADVVRGLDFLTVTLPSGRKLFYAHPYLAPKAC